MAPSTAQEHMTYNDLFDNTMIMWYAMIYVIYNDLCDIQECR